jgi:elongation factor P
VIASDLKTGKIFRYNNQPYLVVKYEHTKTARGGATVKVKSKNLISGSVLEVGYGAGDTVEDADVFRKTMQFLYKDNLGYYFMDPVSYEQITLSSALADEKGRYLKDGEDAVVVYFEETPISLEISNSKAFEVTYTEPGFKGNTVTNAFKDATLENGLVVKVPMFIKIGDKVKVDTGSGAYISKA